MNDKKTEAVEDKEDKKTDTKLPKKKKEIGGADGPEPTRFGDWEKKGITSDFYFLEILEHSICYGHAYSFKFWDCCVTVSSMLDSTYE